MTKMTKIIGAAAIGLYTFFVVTVFAHINLPPSFGAALPLGAVMTCLFLICCIMDGAIRQSEDQSRKESPAIPVTGNFKKNPAASAAHGLVPGQLMHVR